MSHVHSGFRHELQVYRRSKRPRSSWWLVIGATLAVLAAICGGL